MVRTNDGRDGRRKILQIWSLLLLSLKATLEMMMVVVIMVVIKWRRWTVDTDFHKCFLIFLFGTS